jgi:hypothetical protein
VRFLLLGLMVAARLPVSSADGLVLTGLARSGGISHAYFFEPAGGKHFSLGIDEDYAGLRLIEINSRQGWALVADARGTNRVEYARAVAALPLAANPGQLSQARGSNLHLPPPRQRIALSDASGLAEATGSLPSAMDSGAVPFGGTDDTSPATVPLPESAEVSARTVLPRRLPSADELYKTRNGYGAYEEMLRQRHQAEVIAARVAQPNDP